MSKKRAISIFTHLKTDMGERVHAQKLAALIPGATLHDIQQHVGHDFESLANLNLTLAGAGHEPIATPLFHKQAPNDSAILSWSSGVAAMLATGMQPSIVKIYAHHYEEKLLTTLYESASLRITESLLGNRKAKEEGLGRTLYLPHHYTHSPTPSKDSLNMLSKRLKKPFPEGAIIVGCVSRLEYWKNPEFAIETIRQLQGVVPVVLVLKGDFPKESVYPQYETHLREMLEAYKDEPWLFWDREQTSYPEVLEEYASFDFCLQPSGAEGGSNLVVELLGMGKPVIVLDASTNPYLFKGGALFAEVEEDLQVAQLSYARPKLDSLKECVTRLCHPKERDKWSQKAKEIAQLRFHPDLAKERIELMFQLLGNEMPTDKIEKEDCKRYQICF